MTTSDEVIIQAHETAHDMGFSYAEVRFGNSSYKISHVVTFKMTGRPLQKTLTKQGTKTDLLKHLQIMSDGAKGRMMTIPDLSAL